MNFRFFRAELNISVKESQQMLYGKGSAGTKKMAAQNCALSLVRQLFHLGVLEAAGVGQIQPKKAKVEEEVKFLDFLCKFVCVKDIYFLYN